MHYNTNDFYGSYESRVWRRFAQRDAKRRVDMIANGIRG